MARASLQAALRKGARGEPEIVADTTQMPIQPASQQSSRVGKVNVTGYFPPEVKTSLRLVQARRSGTLQDILAEALNDLFAKYNVPQTAPREGSDA